MASSPSSGRMFASRLPIYLLVLLVGAPLSVYVIHQKASADRAPPESATLISADALPEPDPVRFLELCLERYEREVHGYRCTFEKRERVTGALNPREVIEADFRERPYSVYLRWLEGARKAERVVYVEGQNGGKMLVRPRGPLARALVGEVVPRDADGPEARQSGRYTVREFGMKKATERTLAAWRRARAEGRLHVEYQGVVLLAEAGKRPCYKLRRLAERPEDDGVTEIAIYLDRDRWLQVGSVLRGAGGRLVGEYFFRDVQTNPEPKPGQFEANALKP